MIPVLVPRRADGGRRDAIWAHLRDTYWPTLPYTVVEGVDEGPRPFCRSAALNQAAKTAGDWEVAIVADSDTFVDAGQLQAAVDLAMRTKRLVIAHDEGRDLTEETTLALLAGQDVPLEFDHLRVRGATFSGVLVVPRWLWDRVGGFDEAFVGYGWEDLAFARACQLAASNLERVPGVAWHLHHEPSTATFGDPHYEAGFWRHHAYMTAHFFGDLPGQSWN